MGRKTKVVGVSMPPEVEKQFVDSAQSLNMTKSEFFRHLLNQKENADIDQTDNDLATAMKNYWHVRESIDQPVRVVGLALITSKNKTLIVSRAKKDELVPSLGWAFPGGTLNSMDFKTELGGVLMSKLGTRTKIGNLISARLIPESSHSKEAIIALYFSAEISSTIVLEKKSYKDYKWVSPLGVFKFFSTSTSDEVTRYLASR